MEATADEDRRWLAPIERGWHRAGHRASSKTTSLISSCSLLIIIVPLLSFSYSRLPISHRHSHCRVSTHVSALSAPPSAHLSSLPHAPPLPYRPDLLRQSSQHRTLCFSFSLPIALPVTLLQVIDVLDLCSSRLCTIARAEISCVVGITPHTSSPSQLLIIDLGPDRPFGSPSQSRSARSLLSLPSTITSNGSHFPSSLFSLPAPLTTTERMTPTTKSAARSAQPANNAQKRKVVNEDPARFSGAEDSDADDGQEFDEQQSGAQGSSSAQTQNKAGEPVVTKRTLQNRELHRLCGRYHQSLLVLIFGVNAEHICS